LIAEPLDEALKNAATTRPEIIQNNIAAEVAQAQLLVEKSRYYPNLNFIAQYQIQTQANDFNFKNYNWPNSFFVGLQLNIPIFSGFKNDVRVKQGHIAVEQVKLQQQQLAAQIALEVNNAQQALQETYATWQSQTNIIPSAQRNLQLITARWQKGIAKYSDVADAEFTLIQVKNNQLQAAYNYFLAKAQYLKATNTSK
jgi:outer membrane protein TolC